MIFPNNESTNKILEGLQKPTYEHPMPKHDPTNKECDGYLSRFIDHPCTCPEVKEDITPEWEELVRYLVHDFEGTFTGQSLCLEHEKDCICGATDWILENVSNLLLAREQEARTKAIDEAMEELKKVATTERSRDFPHFDEDKVDAQSELLSASLTALQALKNK